MTSPRPLRVVSWNVLADDYVRVDWFPLTNPALLERGARTPAVIAMITALDADVICLQEATRPLADALTETFDGYDVRWCPKGQSRPDGCVTAVRAPWVIADEAQLVYHDRDPITGHVAHVLTLTHPDHGATDETVTVANTHLRWAEPGTNDTDHIGLIQARQLTDHLAAHHGDGIVAIAADTNDAPGGPVRSLLSSTGYIEAGAATATSLVHGTEPAAIDVVAVRGATPTRIDTGIAVAAPLPGPHCPSDHVPVSVDIDVAS